MKFVLVDRIVALDPRQRIVGEKAVSLAEEYLADHFPTFPVLPGVLMVEAMVQTSAWLVRAAEDFAHSLIVLKDARNVTYKSFVVPGQILRIEAVCKELGAEQSVFQASGSVNGQEIVKGRLTLRHLNLADVDAAQAATDDRVREAMRARFALLKAPAAAARGLEGLER